ncbi:hypothetical protein B0H19DRAFT_515007 [Mycena capillaripes]|nr:hypothetical protein B0H19DRAFT_515007 [Mycena capillaripes]
MSTLATKRQRTEDAPITRSDIWYPDGSVVLQAENTQFCVHWGVLSQNSTFFRDMQGLPQPSEQPTVDSCPVVELHDAAEDVEHLLTTLYNPTLLFQKALPFPVVVALIRLGRKYEFRNLLDAAVGLVMCDNPATLEEYLARGNGERKILGYTRIDMLALVRENNILSALPCAYYHVVRSCTQSELFDGVPRLDGTLACLDANDIRRCNLSREKIIAKQIQPGYTLGFFTKWDYDAGCTHARTCGKTREKMFQSSLNPLGIHALDNGENGWKDVFCAACFRHIKDLIDAGRTRMWEELPSFFDLPPWSELKNDL